MPKKKREKVFCMKLLKNLEQRINYEMQKKKVFQPDDEPIHGT